MTAASTPPVHRFTIAPRYHPWGTKFRFHRPYQRPDRLVEEVAGDLADPAAVIAGFLGDSGHAAAQQPASRVEAEAVLEHLRVRQERGKALL